MKLITISGLDGSGKSTQIEMLKKELKSQDFKVFYFHAVTFSLAQKIIEFKNKYCLICRLTGKCKTSNSQEKSVTKSTTFQIILRKIFLRIDIWRFSLLRNSLRNSGYDYILSDRYFYDSVINIEYLSLLKPSFRKFLKLGFRKPDVAIYLQTSPELIMQRERVPDQGLEYLRKKKELYDTKTFKWNWIVLDGNQNKNIVFEELKKVL